MQRRRDRFFLRFNGCPGEAAGRSWTDTPPLFSLGIWPWKKPPILSFLKHQLSTYTDQVYFYPHPLLYLPSGGCAGTASFSGAGKDHLFDLTAHQEYFLGFQPHKSWNVPSTDILAALDWVTVPPCCAHPPRSWTAAQCQEYNPGLCASGSSVMDSDYFQEKAKNWSAENLK